MSKEAVFLAKDNADSRARLDTLNLLAKQNGDAVVFKFADAALSEADLAKECKGAIAIHPGVPRSFTTDLIRKLPDLKLVQTGSAGTDWLDKTALAEMGVRVANNGGANAVAVAEHAIALMFSVYRKLDVQIASVKAGTWMDGVKGAPEEYHTLVGKRVGIVGLGRIGSRVAKRLQGWECDVVFHDVTKFAAEYEQASGARRVSFETLLSTSDIVTLHVPLERTTKHMMSDREFALMKPTAILVNTCRGPVVDEAALIRAVQKKTIFGAGLDVTEIEPVSMDNPLLKMQNVVVTPHLATRAIESNINAAEFVVANISRLARGGEVLSIVPPV
ncbi:MAG: lactate dehydrogenase [Dehalococcoidia bacterium]|nr:lactate dehydrogenase [Dehalococcoidia bacterium]MSQ34695.1 lactate dehydrogenase [Dehalococcoidia bacterium]